jgi:SAM-dependent methyltransferase
VTDTHPSPEWAPFDKDAAHNQGYLYTTGASLSSRIAARRQSDAILAALAFSAKRVIDIGCGDGTYTVEIYDRGQPSSVYGLDPAPNAIDTARSKTGGRNITYETASAYDIPTANDMFDVAQLRGVLHHLDRPVDALREAMRVAPVIVVLEPNGYNLGLKAIEKLSTYHRDHGEKSYAPANLERWVRELGGRVVSRDWVGLVPYFCPDWFARTMKVIEPVVESVPLLNRLGCGTFVMVAARTPSARLA